MTKQKVNPSSDNATCDRLRQCDAGARPMSHQGKRTKAHTLFEIELLWPYDNPANIARRLGYSSVDNMLRTLERWPEGEVGGPSGGG